MAAARSIPVQASAEIGIVPSSKSAHYARHWLELLGCTLGDGTTDDRIVITGGGSDVPDARCVIRLWDFQVGFPGSGTMASAISGASAVIGHPGRPGVPLPADMPEKWCGAYGAILGLAELWRGGNSPSGKQIVYDVSAADVLRAFALQNSGDAEERSRIWRRNGRLCVDHGGIFPMGFFACKDGYVAILGRSRRDWVQIRKAIGDPEWAQAPAFEDPFKLAYDSTKADALLERTLSAFSRDELLQRGLAEGAVIAPVYNAEEARQRDIFRDDFISGGAPAMPFLAQPLGGISKPKAQRPASAGGPDAPLAGLRCMELCWVWSGPMVGQILADLGADVVKVEAPKRFDLYRTRGLETKRGQMDERTRIESSIYFHSLNRNKVGLALDLKQGKGLEIAKQLAASSDLLIENFTVGTMERMGLSADTLAAANPNLVQLSMSGPGRGSGVQDLRSYGLVLSALGGAEALIHKDGEFLGSPTFSISDPNAALFGVLAALAGMLAVREGDAGRQIDLSQIEAAATLAGGAACPQTTRDAILATGDGKIIAASVPHESVADEAALRHMIEGMSYAEAVQHCRELGGYTADLLGLDDTENAPEFSGCSGWLPSSHPCTGDELLVAAPWRIDGRRPGLRKPAPLLGEGDDFVLRHFLSLEEEKIVSLKTAGVVGMPATKEQNVSERGNATS